MTLNSDVKFLQPSGGAISNIRTAQLIPASSSSPSLPSGSVFLRANDGQREGLVIRNETDSFGEARTVQGTACYFLDSEDGPSSPVAVGGADTAITFDAGKIQRGHIFDINQAGDEVIIHMPGLYRFGYTLVYQNQSGGGANDGTVLAMLQRNAVKVPGTEMRQYISIQADGGRASTNAAGVVVCSRGDILSVVGGVSAGPGSVDVVRGTFTLELIRPSGL